MGKLAGIGAVSLLPGCSKQKPKKQVVMSAVDNVWYQLWEKREVLFSKEAKKSKPNGLNIIVIMTDTWRADHLGCYGSTVVKTPYIYKFAKESIVFTDARAEGLLTIPRRRLCILVGVSMQRQNSVLLTQKILLLQKCCKNIAIRVHLLLIPITILNQDINTIKKNLTRKSMCRLTCGTKNITRD